MIWIPTLETLLSARVLRKKDQSRKLKELVQFPKKALIARERKTQSNPFFYWEKTSTTWSK